MQQEDSYPSSYVAPVILPELCINVFPTKTSIRNISYLILSYYLLPYLNSPDPENRQFSRLSSTLHVSQASLSHDLMENVYCKCVILYCLELMSVEVFRL